jgi:hypothetical protein
MDRRSFLASAVSAALIKFDDPPNTLRWEVIPPQRYRGYNTPLFVLFGDGELLYQYYELWQTRMWPEWRSSKDPNLLRQYWYAKSLRGKKDTRLYFIDSFDKCRDSREHAIKAMEEYGVSFIHYKMVLAGMKE